MRVFTTEMTPTPLTVSQVLDLGALTIRCQRDGDAHVLALYGELDVASAGDVEAELRRIEAAVRPASTVLIDLRRLTFIDSTGLRLLVEASNRAETAPYRLRLLQPKDPVFRVCAIAGLDTLLPFERAAGETDA